MHKFLICLTLLVLCNSAFCKVGTQNSEAGIRPGKYEIIAKGHVWTDELDFEENDYVRNTGEKIQIGLFGNTDMKNKISCLTDNFDFFIKSFRGEVPIEGWMACAYNTKESFKEKGFFENWYITFSNNGSSSLDVQINEDSQTDEPFKIDVVSSGTRNKSQYWIATSSVFDCPLMIGEFDDLNLTTDNAGDYYIFIPRDKIVFFYILSNSNHSHIGTHEYVDLALPSGTLWATCNIGADSPDEFGDYFAWGETVAKDFYSNKNYKFCASDLSSYQTQYIKYVIDESSPAKDGLARLEASDDVATVVLGPGWRLPTEEEINELIDKCTWTWGKVGGVEGFKVKSKVNGNEIFLPAAGEKDVEGNVLLAGSRMSYLGSSLSSTSLYFMGLSNSAAPYSKTKCKIISREIGCSARPVKEK